MKTNKYIGILIAMLALLSACGESLEDTYKDYAGDGEIRYLGRCTDLMVAPGWERILVTWKNNIDPAIQQVKVSWMLDEQRDSVLLERGTTEYSIDQLAGQPLADGNYAVSVSGVDVNGNASLAETKYIRPYTYSHEEIISFNRVISKLYVVDDRLILFFSEWQDNMKEAVFTYTKADGTAGELELSKAFFDELKQQNNGLFYLLDDAVSATDAFILNRRAELPDCKDEIEFQPYTFEIHKTYDADFVQEMSYQYGFAEIPDDWANTVETIWLDRSIGSFESLLNMPNLKRLVLGGRRYQLPASVDDVTYGQSSVSSSAAADFILKVLNDLHGLTVERYNKHFKELAAAPYITDQGSPAEPSVDFIDLSGLTYTEYPVSGIASGLANLKDNNPATYWYPEALDEFRTYELTLDLQQPRTLHGLCFVQREFNTLEELVTAPEYIRIRVSADGYNWTDATPAVDAPVGKSNGEKTYVSFTDEVQATQWQYLQVQVNNTIYGTQSNYYVSIGDLLPY